MFEKSITFLLHQQAVDMNKSAILYLLNDCLKIELYIQIICMSQGCRIIRIYAKNKTILLLSEIPKSLYLLIIRQKGWYGGAFH